MALLLTKSIQLKVIQLVSADVVDHVIGKSLNFVNSKQFIFE